MDGSEIRALLSGAETVSDMNKINKQKKKHHPVSTKPPRKIFSNQFQPHQASRDACRPSDGRRGFWPKIFFVLSFSPTRPSSPAPSIVRQPNPLEFLALASSFQNRLIFQVLSFLNFPRRLTRGRTGLHSEPTSDTKTISGLPPSVPRKDTVSSHVPHIPGCSGPVLGNNDEIKTASAGWTRGWTKPISGQIFSKTAVDVVFN